MNVDPLELGHIAFEDVCCLVGIGPRPAGSAAERRALAWIRGQLDGLGYTTQVDEFAFPPQPAFFPFYALAGLGFMACALLLPVFPWAALGLPLLVAALPDMVEWFQRRLPATGRSVNLLGLPPQMSLDQIDLLFVTHVDTARAMPSGAFIHRLRGQAFDVMQRLAVILALLGIVYGVRIPVGQAVTYAAVTLAGLTALGLLGLDLYDQLGTSQQHTVGANDNASGAAVLLAAARMLAHDSPQNMTVGFLFTGAEEAGLYGARHAAQAFRSSGSRARILSVDMVGSGDKLRIITGTKALRRIKTDPQINAWLERADHGAVGHTAIRRSGDFLPFLQAGFAASAIESNGTPEFWHAYHTLDDALYLVQPEMLGQAGFCLVRVGEIMRNA